MLQPDGKGVVVLGATSAIAKSVAREFARRGYSVALGARDTAEAEAIARDIHLRFQVDAFAIPWDALETASHQGIYDDAVDRFGEELAGVVLCSGAMTGQRTAECDWDAARTMLDTNFTGSVSIIERFAHHFEKRETGFIGVVSSVAGDRGRQSNYFYGAAKAGLSAYLQGLRNRLHRSHVSVTTIKPGFVDTKMTWGQDGLFLVANPEDAARMIVRAILKRRNTVYVPWFWRYIMMIIRAIPEPVFKRMKL